jgi:hypothetical protein
MAAHIKLINGLFATEKAGQHYISGNTFNNKDYLKSLGAKWSPDDKMWLLPAGTDIKPLLAPPPPKPTKYLRSDRKWICAKKKPAFRPENVQGPLMWVCPCCPVFYSCYTGD